MQTGEQPADRRFHHRKIHAFGSIPVWLFPLNTLAISDLLPISRGVRREPLASGLLYAIAKTMNSFRDLLQLHRRLDGLFLEHQRALLRLNLSGASQIFDQYEGELLAHIQDEESLMIPLYAERVTAPVGGAPDIFLGEHNKLRQFLVLFKEELNKLGTVDDLERGVLFLIDSEHLFKRLLVHHDTREKKMLYPLLDTITTGIERQALFKQLQLSPDPKSDAVGLGV